jgi:hypothetical protein
MKTRSEILDEMVKQNQEMGLYDFPTKPGFVERRMKLGKITNYKAWDELYESYKGVSDLHDFLDWLKENYIAPEKI